jgi:hypothetical protein
MWKTDKNGPDSGIHDTAAGAAMQHSRLRAQMIFFWGLAEVEMYRGRRAAAVNYQVDR